MPIHRPKSSQSQRARTNSSLYSPSRTMTCATELSTSTLVPGRRARCTSARQCGESTVSVRRGSITSRRAPRRMARFIIDPNTGWPSVGLAPTTSTTSDWRIESKCCDAAPAPNVADRPN